MDPDGEAGLNDGSRDLAAYSFEPGRHRCLYLRVSLVSHHVQPGRICLPQRVLVGTSTGSFTGDSYRPEEQQSVFRIRFRLLRGLPMRTGLLSLFFYAIAVTAVSIPFWAQVTKEQQDQWLGTESHIRGTTGTAADGPAKYRPN